MHQPNQTAKVPPRSELDLNVVIAFQNIQTWKWAVEAYARVNWLAGDNCVRCTWWEIHRLASPEDFPKAVQAAIWADVMIISLNAADAIPRELCSWIEAWLPHRRLRTGLLMALISFDEHTIWQMVRVRKYLKMAAHFGQLDFLPHEQRLSRVADWPFEKNDLEQAGMPWQTSLEILNSRRGDIQSRRLGR